jgi:hypothetical protein
MISALFDALSVDKIAAALLIVMAAALLFVGKLYTGALADLGAARTSLETAQAVNDANIQAQEKLERSMAATDKALAAWDQDRTTLAGVRAAARQAIKEAMRDETFRSWAVQPVPADAWRLLRETPDPDRNADGVDRAAGGSDGGLPAIGDPGKRQ